MECYPPHMRGDVLCAVIKRGDEKLVHWAMVAAADCEPHVHAAVLSEAARSDNEALALEAVRSQAVLENKVARVRVLGRALSSEHEAIALEATERLREFDLRDQKDTDYRLQHDVCDALCSGVRETKHESVALQILDLATQPGLGGRHHEFRVVCKAQDCGLGPIGRIARIARARVVEMQKANPDLNEFAYRH